MQEADNENREREYGMLCMPPPGNPRCKPSTTGLYARMSSTASGGGSLVSPSQLTPAGSAFMLSRPLTRPSPGMARWPIVVACVWLAVTPLLAADDGPPNAGDDHRPRVTYEGEIASIFARHCIACHGPEKQESGLRVDVRASLLRGGDFGEPSIVPGSGDTSFLVSVVSGENDDLIMPPAGPRLSADDVARLRTWIDQGARMPAGEAIKREIEHWSFRPLTRPIPPGQDEPWVRNPIDAFVLARLAANGLGPSPRADRVMLIRRLYLVVLGVLPDPEAVARFVEDNAAGAYERLVDRLLASPRYGERWARHWLDVVRFGETHGFETNRERPHAWRYRDYVIEAFNADKPYDQFVREQLAGDAYGEDAATGFLVAGPYDLVKSQDVNLTLMQRQDELADMINTTGTTFVGLTLGCARCHNHKFDPVTQRDYYAMQAVFAGVEHGDRPTSLSASRREQRAAVEREVLDLRRKLAPFIPPARTGFVLLDDAQNGGDAGRGLEPLHTPEGQGTNPAGNERGHADDPGAPDRSPNLSGGQYTWWKNQPREAVAVYRPRTTGRHRIWLSWGCGWESHTQDANYVLDDDGDLSTISDQHVIAVVDQQRFARSESPPPGKSLWSGFLDAGVHQLTANSAVALVAGQTGEAITADVLALEALAANAPVAAAAEPPRLRPAVNARQNEERFQPLATRRVRFTIQATNQSQPCLDELQVFAGEVNVAAAAEGARATCSSALPGYPIHQLEHINDGKFGNSHSWISNEDGGGWVQIEFAETATIDRITWGRDRDGKYSDRVPTEYTIEAATESGEWVEIAGSADRLPHDSAGEQAVTYRFAGFDRETATAGRRWLNDLEQAERRLEELATTPTVYAGTFRQPGPTHRLYRGEPTAKREEVVANAPEHFGDLGLDQDTPEQRRRIKLAEWIAEDNRLTARSLVNRLWHYHFGTGIVDTPNDLGVNGTRPTHPELLDWLASEAIEGQWSIKQLHRVILLSNTFCQSSHPREDGLSVDAASRLLWRFPPRRLEAEAIRDNMLLVSGVLDLRMGGPGFSAFEVELENVRHYFPKKSYGPADWRRMVYMTKVRQEQDSVFGAFDCPDASQAVPRRSRSTTPLQALNLFNSLFTMDQSQRLAKRLDREAGPGIAPQVERAFALVFSRRPSPPEMEAAVRFVDMHGLTAFCRALLNANEFLFVP